MLAYAVLSLLAALVPQLLTGAAPWQSDAALQAAYRDHQFSWRLGALFVVAAAAPLAVATAVFSARIERAGLRVPGRLILLLGGGCAATVLACSGMLQFAMTQGEVATRLPLLQFGQGLATALGGTAFALFVGLLVAGVAVPGLLGGLLPRPLALTGVVLAVVCELGVLSTVVDGLAVLLPIARFGSMLWLLAAAVSLRGRTRAATRTVAAAR